jgi:hypothetical protein
MQLADVRCPVGASVEVDARWEHLGDQRLLRIQVSSGEPAWRQRRQLLSLAVARNINLRGFNCHQRPLHLSVERQSQRALPRLAKPQLRRWNRSRAKPTNHEVACRCCDGGCDGDVVDVVIRGCSRDMRTNGFNGRQLRSILTKNYSNLLGLFLPLLPNHHIQGSA